MNKEPQEVDWSKQKPGTIGVTKGGVKVEYICTRNGAHLWHGNSIGWVTELENDDVRLPWESCIAEGHNPDGLTNGQVGDGWRLASTTNEAPDPKAEIWYKIGALWMTRMNCDYAYENSSTYRVPITPPVAKATKRVPCGPEHFPPGTILRHNDFPNAWPMVIWVESHGIGSMDSNGNFVKETYSQIVGFNGQRSIDGGKTWLPCYVEVEA